MRGSGVHLRIFPDALRREWALADAVSRGVVVDPSAWLTWSECFGAKAAELDGALRLSLALQGRGEPWPDAPLRGMRTLFEALDAAQVAPRLLLENIESLPEGARGRVAALGRLFEHVGQAPAPETLTVARELVTRADRISLLVTEPLAARELASLLTLAGECERAKVALAVQIAAVGDPEVDAALEGVLATLERGAQALNWVELAHAPMGPLAERAAQALTQSAASAAAPLPVVLFAARAPADEAELTARRIQRLLAEGARASAIAVGLAEGSAEEEARFASALERRGIPCIRPLARLDGTTAGRRTVELLTLEDDGFPSERVAPFVRDPSSEVPTADVLLAEAGVRDEAWGAQEGQSGYAARLGALAQRLRRRGRSSRVAAVVALEARCRELLAGVKALPREATFRVWHEQLEALAARWTLSADGGNELAEGLGRVRDCVARAGAAERRMSKARFVAFLREALSVCPRRDGVEAGTGVWLVDASRLGGGHFDHVLLVGLEEGRVRSREEAVALFPEEARAPFNRAQGRAVFPLRLGDARLSVETARERLAFVQALGAARCSASLSFVRAGWGGDARAPSEPLLRFANAVGLEVPEAGAVRFDLDAATSEAELRVMAARSIRAVGPLEGGALATAVEAVLGDEPWLFEAKRLAQVEEERLRFFSDLEAQVGPHSGAIPQSRALVALLEHGPERPLSASALSRWGNCAFQGWLGTLRLERRELPVEDIDPRAQGVFWHRVLERLLPQLAGKREPPAPALVEKVLAEVVAELKTSGATGHPALWRLAKENARRMVERLVDSGALAPLAGLAHAGVEIPFGRPSASEAWRTVRLPGLNGEPDLHFEGKIDRLDGAGDDVVVLDYKSGARRSDRELLDALLVTEFQLPLYLYAARSAGHAHAHRAAWVSLRTGEVRELEPLLARAGQTVDGLLSTAPEVRADAADRGAPNLANAVQALFTPLREGRFAIRSKDCAHCGLEGVCRVSQRRLVEET